MTTVAFGLDPSLISFPFKDEISLGESGQGYALRMCEKNALPNLGYIKQLLGKSHTATLDARDAPFLAYWFGASVQRMTFALERIPSGKRSFGSIYAGQELGRAYFLNRSFPRICPQCLVENGYYRMAWEISLCVACPIHHCILIERCPVCDGALSWGRPALQGCGCGYMWHDRVGVSKEPTLDEFWVSYLLDQIMPDRCMSVIQTQCPSWVSLLRPLSLDGMMRIMFALATAKNYDGSFIQVPRKRSSIWKAQQTIALATDLGSKLALLEPVRLRPHRPSVLVELLCDLSCSPTSTTGDLSTAQSMLHWLLQHVSKSKIGSIHASLAQKVLF